MERADSFVPRRLKHKPIDMAPASRVEEREQPEMGWPWHALILSRDWQNGADGGFGWREARVCGPGGEGSA
eukprot:603491-Rhodomonas_salina.1